MKALSADTVATAARRSLAVLSFLSISAFSFFPELAVSQTVYLVTPEGRHAVELSSNAAARSLAERMPLEVTFEDYGSTERIAYLKNRLDISGAPDSCTPAVGDLTYYSPWGNLAVFVKPFRHSEGLVPLGKLSPEALEAVKRSGDAVLRFEVAE